MTNSATCPQCGTPLPADSKHQACPRCLLGLGLDGTPGRPQVTTSPFVEDERGWSIDELEARFPQLRIEGLIGKGGMGAVYKAQQKSLDRSVALKVLPIRASGDPTFEERFVREAKTLAKLNHPNIVTVFESGENQGLFFFLMEYVDGVNLRSLMSEGSLTSQEALAIVGQICDALQYAHEMGIVHRDIKPENVLIDQRGQVKIADFGLAKILEKPALDMTLTSAHQVVGTPHYMAPEQMERPREVDHRADIYSLGVVFYELLTGELPLGRFAPPSEKARVGGDLDDIVLRSLEKEPGNRYQSAGAVKTDVHRLHGGDAAETNGRTHEHEPRQHEPRGEDGDLITVPITLPSQFEGIYDYVGILKLHGATLNLQFRGQEGFTGSSPMGTKERDIQLADIDAIEFKPGLGKHTILLTPNNLRVADKIPGVENGKVKIHVARADREQAEALVQACGLRSGPTRISVPDRPTNLQARKAIQAPSLGLILFAVLGMISAVSVGGFALAEEAIVEPGSWEFGLISGASLAYLALQGFILYGGVQMYLARNRGLAQAASIAALVPTSPWSALGVAMGIWSLVVLSRDESIQAFELSEIERQRLHDAEEASLKPDGLQQLRIEAAQRLSFPTAVLRYCGWLSIGLLGVAALLLSTQDSLLNASRFNLVVLAGVGLLVPSCFLVLARPSAPRGTLLCVATLGAMPISLLWPITAIYSVWSWVILSDPDVREAQAPAPLPKSQPTAAVSTLAIIVLSVSVSAVISMGLGQWNKLRARDEGGAAAPVTVALYDSVPLSDAKPSDAELEATTRCLQQRFDEADLQVQVSLGENGRQQLEWAGPPSDEQTASLERLCRVVGRLELAVLRDAGKDGQGAVDASAEAEDLPLFVGDSDSHPAGLRLAVVTATRFDATGNLTVRSVSGKESGRSQTLECKLSSSGRRDLVEHFESILSERDDATKPIEIALIVDGEVWTTGRVLVSEKKEVDAMIRTSGFLGLLSESEWKAVEESGPLPVRLEAASPDEDLEATSADAN